MSEGNILAAPVSSGSAATRFRRMLEILVVGCGEANRRIMDASRRSRSHVARVACRIQHLNKWQYDQEGFILEKDAMRRFFIFRKGMRVAT